MRGTFRKMTGSSVSRQAAKIGSAAFLFPEGVTSPRSGTPPSTMNFSMHLSYVMKRIYTLEPNPPKKGARFARPFFQYLFTICVFPIKLIVRQIEDLAKNGHLLIEYFMRDIPV
jgi:hypothetical protein